MKVPSEQSGRQLFRSPAWQDWAMWLGIVAAGFTTTARLRPYFSPTTPNLGFMTSGEMVAFAIDALLGFFITFALFGLLPAAIRRRTQKQTLTLDVFTGEPEKSDRSRGLLPIVALGLAILAADLDARSAYPDTTKAESARTAREAFENLSSEQISALTTLRSFAGDWNQLVERWVDLYRNPNLGFQAFGTKAQPIVAELGTLVANASSSQRLLTGTPAEPLFSALVAHYETKLAALQGLTTAITLGDGVGEQRYEEMYAQINSRDQSVVCEGLMQLFASPFVGAFDDAELQSGVEQLANC